MKVDGLGVVLAIILLPILLVVAFYIQMQVDTVAKENSYNTKLLSATYDAMSAFEMNTANEELSNVADSMRSIILASNNVLLKSLANNLGISNASKENLRPYIPAVLYTLYDGYYIYSPTQIPVVAEKTEEGENGLITTKGYVSVGDEGTDNLGGVYGDVVYEKENGEWTVNKNEARKKTDYVLKSYVPYSARYARDTIDVTINYTLDNYLNIIGKIGNQYYTKTGYFIQKNLVTNFIINGENYAFHQSNEDDAKNKILGQKTNTNQTTIDAAQSLSLVLQNETIQANWNKIVSALTGLGYYQSAEQTGTGYANIRTISEAEIYLQRAQQEKQVTNLADIQNLEYEIGKYKAIAYYTSAAIFSNWVYENLGSLEYGDIQNEAMTQYYANAHYESTANTGKDDLYYDFSGNTTKIFEQTQNPEDTESNFNTHKTEIIKNSIKYNLNLAISAYCQMRGSQDFSLPVLLDEEWDKILQNISIVSFMQGLDCGLAIYNNYEIASSTNNEVTVTPSEIYFVKKDEFNNGTATYHRIDCPYLDDGEEYISFSSKEVKYDGIYDSNSGKYQYDHKNLACYTCINTNNYEKQALSTHKSIANDIGLAKEKQNVYKTNALPVSEGYQILLSSDVMINVDHSDYKEILSFNNTAKMKKIQLTFASTASKYIPNNREPVLKLRVRLNANDAWTREIHLNLDQVKEQTVTIDVSDIDTIHKIELSRQVPGDNYKVGYTVKSIKAR